MIHDPELPNVGITGNVVLRLAKIIPKRFFYKISFDNWFSTVPLVTELEKLGIQRVATVRSNRLKNCEFSSDKVTKTKGRGSSEILSTSIDRVTINTCEVEPLDIVKRWDKKIKRMIDVQRPNIVKIYNQHMGGVDLRDYSSYSVNPGRQYSLLEFKTDTASCLCQEHKETPKKRGRPASNEVDKQLQNKRKKKPNTTLPVQNVRKDEVAHWPIFSDNRGRCKKSG
ncbi:PREDICTED: piggyBac transposable element-derived protein 3-like, partial [Eufriesea mexicana]|uniref:piggyBac transposable element-derived protein 3-like n=1 Tax=Eufriesea mexicana TaxID=516756 RepID=UPI00083BBF50